MLIKNTLIPPPSLDETPEFESIYEDHPNESSKEIDSSEMMTIETAIKSCLQNFFEKRRASGDERPCGPHDMGPIYRAVFGIAKEDLRDEKFLSRLRRTGLGGEKQREDIVSGSVSGKNKKKGQKG
ncbi:hypothetical protein GLAREA_01330 [Glarea lozoyensis ATCC 20868]|uniref:Uncharacterized protein n=1 Tax=Glarea lozoyensis (strain ATCC 20868 / MF5171) TaxID=1116229 RepID=S3DFK1_GLAL2|nr:uncharacterized protein GLAREA_01330 [Glarea lozoyensis ATCC 20868]EPE25418.1 hypothetical protein GLAREA_01330 [Glarea lozoyensis ATCC 20868]